MVFDAPFGAFRMDWGDAFDIEGMEMLRQAMSEQG
jgi:hypothetical protein